MTKSIHISFQGVVVATSLFLSLSACSPQKATQGNMGELQGSQNIVHGTDLTADDILAKSVIALADDGGESKRAFCSGTLISKNTLLTAGHCGEYMQGHQTYVLFGLTQEKAVALKVVGTKINEGYNNDTSSSYGGEQIGKNWHDIALVKFEGNVPAGYVPAKMLKNDALLVDGDTVTLAGFGLTSGGYTGTGAGTLRKTNVPVAKAKYSEDELVTDESNAGSCNGDSGGPVFLNKNNQIYLVGVTSRGDQLCVEFGIYSAVARFQDWILKTNTALGGEAPL